MSDSEPLCEAHTVYRRDKSKLFATAPPAEISPIYLAPGGVE
nr:MAG TPA: hypothetical protein [Caudoviricetes sp.]